MNKRSIILILGLAGFTVMADNWVVSPLLPAISKDFGVAAASAGILITAYMIPFGIFQLVFGPLADRFGKKQVITLAMILFTIGTGLCAIGNSLGNLALYRVLAGIFAASVMPVSLALIGDLVPMQERQAAIGSFMGISFLGQGLSMAIGGAMAYVISWRGAFVLYAILAILSVVLLLTAGKKIPSLKNPQSEFLAPYSKLLTNKVSLFTYIIVIFEGFLILGSFSYIGAFVSDVYHYNFLQIGLIATCFGIMTVIGGRLSGRLANKIGKKRTLIAGLILATLADLILYSTGDILGMLIIAVALLGSGFIFAHSTLLTVATEFAQKSRGIAMSLVAACFMGGGGIGTAIGSRLITNLGFSYLYLFYGLAFIILVLAAFLMIQIKENQVKTINVKPVKA
jgi:predicted MFS family arabinose efflux permease